MYKSEHIITLRHYLVLSVTAFTFGIIYATTASAKSLSFFVQLLILTAALSSVFLFLRKVLIQKYGVPKKPFVLPLFLCICVLLGIFRITAENILFPSRLDSCEKGAAWLTGTVKTNPKATKDGFSCYFQMEVFQINDEDIPSESIMIFMPKARGMKLSKNQDICCWARIEKHSPIDKSNIYNYETTLKGNGIFHTGSVKNANLVTFTKSTTAVSKLQSAGEAVSSLVTSAINKAQPLSHNNALILKGILVGDKADFSDTLYQKFSYAGLSHIVAVSGMHLSILFAAITLILNSLKLRKRLSLVITIPLVVLFAATAKFTPSVCRAGIMILMMLIASIFLKRYSPINALFLSLGIILCVSPYSVYSQSLTLSFCATLGILVYYKYIAYFLNRLIPLFKTGSDFINNIVSAALKFVLSSVAISISVTITTSYFSLLFFGSVSWAQFLTNIWIIPTVTAVFCLGYAVCIFQYLFPLLASILCHPLNFLLDIISATANRFGQVSFTFQLESESLNLIGFVVYMGLAILLYLVLKTAYDLSEETAIMRASHTQTYKSPAIPKL